MNEESESNNTHVNNSDTDEMRVEGTPRDLSKTTRKVKEGPSGVFKSKPIVQKQPK